MRAEFAALGAALADIAQQLNDGEVRNYHAQLRCWPRPGQGRASVAAILGTLAPRPRLLRSEPIDIGMLLHELRTVLGWRGDSGSHANLLYVGFARWQDDLLRLEHAVRSLCTGADLLHRAEVRDGPIEGVHWDVCFVIAAGLDAYVILGGASD